MNPEIFANLRTVLVTLYTDEASIQRVMADAGLVAARIKLNTTVIDTWHFVLTEAVKIDRVEALLLVVEGDYGSNQELRRVCAAYRQAASQLRKPTDAAPSSISQTTFTPFYPSALPEPLPQPLINHDQTVALFRQLLTASAPYRFIRLLGEGNMGKTTLLGKIFPALAQHHTARYAVVDLRNPAQSPLDLLDGVCQQLDPGLFPGFVAAYEAQLAERAQSSQNARAWLGLAQATAGEWDEEGSVRQALAQVTRKFVDDVRTLADQTLVLLFDAVDLASPFTQVWLMDDLLGRLRPLAHVRVVVAGRRLPPAATSYAAACQDHELRRVLDEEAYIRYCQAIGAALPEAQIRLLAQNTGYTPGTFANTVKLFIPRECSHG